METINLAELYDTDAMSWPEVRDRLDAGFPQEPGGGGPNRHTCWLTTLNPDGSPHVTGIGALWVDGAFWFETGKGSRKGRNLARDPRCAMSLAIEEFDLVVEGIAEIVTDRAAVADMAARWAAGGWPARVDDSGEALTADFSAQSAGRPPWHVYRITARTATALGTVEPFGATRWRFD
ncbi:pyridoxamine 5'-phosphate oxidase family protein [Nocardia wallacei]|uniref:Pyridoxamine 5'-phosphate oxidase n=1 Tax=Nocardia wallacei TaxID=480035 RepID=A0A7G1KIB9_9NOCA|nr:pyridoxamine 5'-phosphate oxidase family protein [Nocardia wallacei]BCK53154.1 pyridoxamine 5'-phosphate oxidase [Nocardia wallacei]